MAKHINITDDIKNKIIDFTHGDDEYWKNKFKDVLNELKDIKQCLYCKRWFNEGDVPKNVDFKRSHIDPEGNQVTQSIWCIPGDVGT